MKTLFPGVPGGKNSMQATMQRIGDSAGLQPVETDLSTPIVSTQDGPRMSGKISNFGGKKAAPFQKGGKRRAKMLAAKSAVAGAKSKGKSADLATPTGGFVPKPYDSNGEGADETVTCPKCHKGNDDDARYCDQCGFKLAGAQGVKVKG